MEAMNVNFKTYCREKDSQCVKCSKKIKRSKTGLCKKCIHIKQYNKGDVINDVSFVHEFGIINHRMYWNFQCRCGNYFIASTSSVRSGHTTSCGCKAKELLIQRNKMHKGENHPLWIKDRNLLCEHKRNLHGNFKNFAQRYKKSRNYTCELTKETGVQLDLHHITAVCVNPDLSLVESNVILIKKEIHRKFHLQYGYQVTDKEWIQFVVENGYISV